jgi:hypothetical protein
MKTITGIIHGNTIQLTDNLGLPDGEQVEVHVFVKKSPLWGDGLRRCAGILADDWTDEDDRILEQIQQDRQNATFRELPL